MDTASSDDGIHEQAAAPVDNNKHVQTAVNPKKRKLSESAQTQNSLEESKADPAEWPCGYQHRHRPHPRWMSNPSPSDPIFGHGILEDNLQSITNVYPPQPSLTPNKHSVLVSTINENHPQNNSNNQKAFVFDYDTEGIRTAVFSGGRSLDDLCGELPPYREYSHFVWHGTDTIDISVEDYFQSLMSEPALGHNMVDLVKIFLQEALQQT